MRVLLFSMPDSFEHTPSLTMRMPNAALTSLAGNVDPHHDVAAADLICVQDRVASTVERLVRERQPDVVGLSVMTFQRKTALAIAALIKQIDPRVRVVAGGYDPSLAPEAYEEPALGIDFLVRGEGDITFRELLRTLEHGLPIESVAGVSWHGAQGWVHNAARPVSDLAGDSVRPPRRAARVLDNYTFQGRRIDIVETSRGCTYDCSFCSIIEMRGRNFETWTIERVISDIADARARG